MDLPRELRLGLERELRAHNPRRLAEATADLSTRYRAEGRAPGPMNDGTAAAYAAGRMPATFAATASALSALASGLPALRPRSLLDAGAGTGAALWASAYTWDSLRAATLLERDRAMATLGNRLAQASQRPALVDADWRSADLSGPWEAPPHDLVTAAYVLGELPEAARPAFIERLWQLATSALVLVEPGTPRGWAAIRAAREQLRAAGAMIVAPCPHQELCPMPADDWCHFASRLARTPAQRSAKGAELGYEDEKYSYVAVARQPGASVAARVLRHPVVRPGRIDLTLCTTTGLRRELITRATSEAWRLARALRWGDPIAPGAWEEH